MNRREAIAGMIGAGIAAALPAASEYVAQGGFMIIDQGPVHVTFPQSHGGREIVTFYRNGVAMGRYVSQPESQGKPLEVIWRENGCTFGTSRTAQIIDRRIAERIA